MSHLTTTATLNPVDVQVNRLVDAFGEAELTIICNYTLADAIREGSTVAGQKVGGWIDTDTSCTLSAAVVAATARGWMG